MTIIDDDLSEEDLRRIRKLFNRATNERIQKHKDFAQNCMERDENNWLFVKKRD